MDNTDRINLKKMINTNNVVDFTAEIRNKKHSSRIKNDVDTLIFLRDNYMLQANTMSVDDFDELCVARCRFLFDNYTDIFNKVKKDKMDITIFNRLINVLESIENGKNDQHSGAYEVGKLLKEIYIDGSLRNDNSVNNNEVNNNSIINQENANLTWKEYKAHQQIT